MTTAEERTAYLLQTRRFLEDLCGSYNEPGVPRSVRREAERLLRHFVGRGDIELMHLALPMWFGRLPTHGDRPRRGPVADEQHPHLGESEVVRSTVEAPLDGAAVRKPRRTKTKG